ncbi:hypothetical protein [Rhodanobacter sp. KK11]|jgi:hypothetical protein|nr:hypothetical protein [Rhodanobacter sp. KK11]MDW2981755.1 hypothetical protein [Rhodanobacter sp. KK11]
MGISIEGVVSSKLGLASHQNAVPLLRQLTIANDGTERRWLHAIDAT